MSAMHESYDAFAVSAPGLAPWVAAEVRELGLEVTAEGDAGVAFRAAAAGVYAANLHLRIASRVLIRASSFEAAHFSELERQSRAVPWSRWIPAGAAVTIRATSRKSRLYHSGGVAERVYEAIAHEVKGVTLVAHADEETNQPGQLVVVRIERDACTISIDSSGDLLHRRGYRQAVAKAPLRETLAAAILRASGWDATTPLVDPLCGSGTIPIEAALQARRIPPGLRRHFAFEHWPEHTTSAWQQVRQRGEEGMLPTAAGPIAGSDRDVGAISAAISNAERAGVAGDIEFSETPLSRVTAPPGVRGLLVANPPYGERIGDATALRDLYGAFGKLARTRFVGWQSALLAADARLVGHTGLGMRALFQTSNGGIRVALYLSPAA